MYTILVCDDEQDIVSALEIYLTAEGYRVLKAYNGKEALAVAAREEVHLILMDIMMPVMDGLTAMAQLRQTSNVPVILLTAKSEDTDKVLGLNVGADDYITKPFNPVELLARVRSQLRRYLQLGGGTVQPSTLVIGGIRLDDNAKAVTVDGENAALTPKEYDILRFLMKNAGTVFSPSEIYRRVWDDVPLNAAGAIAGVTAGSLLSLTVLTVFLLRRRDRAAVDVPPARSAVLRELLTAGIPITLGAAGMSLITLLDQTLVTGTLQNTLHYSAAETAALYGEYTFGMTLFALPPSFIYPLSVSLMPAVSAALTRGDRTAAGKAAGAAMKLTVLTALPAGVGLSVLAEPILLLLYPAVPDTARAAAYHLTFLGLACVFVCLMVAANGVLQAYGHPLVPVLALLCGGVLKVVTNYLMVGDPATGIRGAAVSTLYCYALIVLIDLIAIARLVPERPGYIRLFARPVLVTAVMALAARSGYGLFCRVLPERWAVLPAIAVAAAVYGILALAVGAVTRTDVVTLPRGEKIADFLHLR